MGEGKRRSPATTGCTAPAEDQWTGKASVGDGLAALFGRFPVVLVVTPAHCRRGAVLVAWQWLSARTGTLPLVLAGPILRRVEPGLVCVWVATQGAQSVSLTVRASGTEVATVATNVTSALPNGQPTVQLGDHLFVALLTATPPAAAPLQPGVLYSYELAFTSPSGKNKSFADAMSAPGTTPDLSSIVYTDPGSQVSLPSFALPPQTLSQVRLAHASCRKAGGQNPDALPLLDKEIAAARNGATDNQFALNRLHQLFLTGDQIYADDVADSYLGMCIDAAGWLMGTRQKPAPKLLGILGPPDPDNAGNHPFPAQTEGWTPIADRAVGGSTPWDQAAWPGVGVRGKLVFAAGTTGGITRLCSFRSPRWGSARASPQPSESGPLGGAARAM